MASKQMVKDSLQHLSGVYGKQITSDIVDAYFEALRYYNDNDIMKAVSDCINECEWFPKPAEIRKRLPQDDNKHDSFLRARFTCSMCGEKVSAISEGKCLDCAGVGFFEEKRKVEKPPENDFTQHGRMMCQKCRQVGLCIKEPKDTGSWLCTDCYTGLTKRKDKKDGKI